MTRVLYRSGLYSLYSAPVYTGRTVTHFPETLASPPGCLGRSGQAVAGPGLSWPGGAHSPEPGPGWENLENLATCSSQPVAPPPPPSSVSHSQTWSEIQEYFAGTGEIASAQEEPGYCVLMSPLSGLDTRAQCERDIMTF